MVSERTLKSLPDIEPLRRLYQSLAMLAAILSPEWEYRFYSFNSKWGSDEMMASMRDGSGDEYFVLFNSVGAIMKGFAHESPMSPYTNESQEPWPGVLDNVPGEFRDFLSEPAFSIQDATFCIWRIHGDTSWQEGRIAYPEEKDPDGSEDLLAILDNEPSTYQAFAQDYYEQDIDLSAVEHIYAHKPLTEKIVSVLNADVTLGGLKADIEEIGYPKDAI